MPDAWTSKIQLHIGYGGRIQALSSWLISALVHSWAHQVIANLCKFSLKFVCFIHVQRVHWSIKTTYLYTYHRTKGWYIKCTRGYCNELAIRGLWLQLPPTFQAKWQTVILSENQKREMPKSARLVDVLGPCKTRVTSGWVRVQVPRNRDSSQSPSPSVELSPSALPLTVRNVALIFKRQPLSTGSCMKIATTTTTATITKLSLLKPGITVQSLCMIWPSQNQSATLQLNIKCCRQLHGL